MANRVFVGFVVAATLAAACSKSSSTPTPTVTGVVVSGNGAFTAKNETSQLTATANLSDNTSQNVTNSATWSSSNQLIASVSSTGLVTAVSFGQATITAAYQGTQGALAVIVNLKAVPSVTANFQRLCGPFRARIEVTLAETGNSIGYNITSATIVFRDLGGNIRAQRTYAAADIVAAIGSNHINAGSSRVLIYESPYPGNVDTADSSATVTANITDDAGNTQTISLPPQFQHDRC